MRNQMMSRPTSRLGGEWQFQYAGVIGANGAQAALAVLYLGTVSRWLGPADFGLMSAALAPAILLTVLQGPFEMKISKDAATLYGAGQGARLGGLMFRSLRRFKWPLAGWIAISILIAGPISAWLRLGSSIHFVLIAVYTALSFILCLARGVLRGGHRFGAFSASQLLENGGRLVVGLALVSLGGGTIGAITGYVAGTAIATLVALFQLSGPVQKSSPLGDTAATLGPLFVLYLYWTLSANFDVIVARRFLAPEDSGIYAAASNLARMIWLAATPVCHMVLVRSASLEAAGQDGRRSARLAIATLAISLGLSCLIPYTAGSLLLRTIFGIEFASGVDALRILWIATVASVLQTAVTFSQMGTDRIRRPWLFLAPCALLFGLFSFFHDTGVQIAYCVLAASGLACAISALTIIEGRIGRLAISRPPTT